MFMNRGRPIAEPKIQYRPEVRWWLAEGFHTDQSLEAAVESLYRMGFSACEVLTLTEFTIDRQLYGWGSEEYNHDMLTIAKKATELGMGFSFTSGPNWQSSIPGMDINDEAAGQELNFTNVNVKGGETFDGELKPYDKIVFANHKMDEFHERIFANIKMGPNTSVLPQESDLIHRFVAAVAVKFQNAEDMNKLDLNSYRDILPVGPVGPPGKKDVYDTLYFAGNRGEDITDLVEERDGKYYLRWQAPKDGNYAVIVFWRHGTAQIAEAAYAPAVVVSHIEERGPKAMMEYWNEHIFTPEMRDIIKKNGNVDFFQDSLEINTLMSSNLYWCEDFPEQFRQRRGYDVIPYLPTLIEWNHRSMGLPDTSDDDPPRFAFAEDPGLYRRVLDDLHLTQTELYGERYLKPLKEWLNSVGVRLRAQAAYGSRSVSFEMSLPAQYLDIQETETFEMEDVIDYYRVHAGAVHLNRFKLFSAETGAIGGAAYTVSLKEYMKKIHRLYAGGVNRVIMHGYATVSGPENNVQWPGYDGIGFIFTDRWGERNPYGFAIRHFTSYLGRLQEALRAGTAKVDVGIINYMFRSPDSKVVNQYSSKTQEEMLFWKDEGKLALAGYTYEFFAPQYLERFESDGVTFDSGMTDYKALVVWQDIFPETSKKILNNFALQGMPIVVVGDGKVHCESILGLPNVKFCSDPKDVSSALKDLGITPRVDFSEPKPFYTVWKETEEGANLYVMNAGPTDDELVLSIGGLWNVSRLDCWTGIESEYCSKAENSCTTVMCRLAAGDAALFKLRPTFSEHAAPAASADTALPSVTPVSKWNVTIEDWQRGERKPVTETRMGHTTTEYYFETDKKLISFTMDKLVTWDEIPEVGKEVSGIGRYEGTFSLAEDWDSSRFGLKCDLGCVVEMAKVTVNGQFVQCADMLDPVVDISDFVHVGANNIVIEVSTTLANRLIAYGRYRPGMIAYISRRIIDFQKNGLTSCDFKPFVK